MRSTRSGKPAANPCGIHPPASASVSTRAGAGAVMSTVWRVGDHPTLACGIEHCTTDGRRRQARSSTMSLVRLLPAWFHAIADYAVGVTLIAVAVIVGGTGAAVATGVVVGAVVLVVSMLTRYPLGVAKVLPFTVHSAGDYLAAALLVLAPFALGLHRHRRRPRGLLRRRRHRGARGQPGHELPVRLRPRVERTGARPRRLISQPSKQRLEFGSQSPARGVVALA